MPVSLVSLGAGFAVGLAAALLAPGPVPPVWTPVLAGAALFVALVGRRRAPVLVLAALLGGAAYGALAVQQALASRLPVAFEGADALLIGTVSELPQADALRTRLRVDVEQLSVAGAPLSGPRRVLLSWYGERPALRAGERWQLPVRLKAPRGFSNPSGFDYERWLAGEGIDATGYVRPGAARPLPAPPWAAPVQRLRQAIAERLDRYLGQDDAARMVRGLAIGVSGAVSPATWRTLRETGTAHLLAISGLHVALSGLLVYALVGWLWRHLPGLARRVPAPRAAAVAAALGVFGYAALAGFAVPARRTALMFSVAALGAASGRETSPARLLALAGLAVLLFDPLALLASGFWLSFGAVGILLWLALGRLHRRADDERVSGDRPPDRVRGMWRRTREGTLGAVRLQLAVALALTPLTLGFFGLLSPTSVPANLIAVPLLGLLAVPLTLLGVLVLPVPALAGPVLFGAQGVCAGTLAVLEALRGLAPGLLWTPVPWPLLAACLVGVLVLLLPRGFAGRWLGVLWCLPAVLYRPSLPPVGAFSATVLDVGQGLAVVVRTRDHALVYDSGPRFSERFSAGEAIVLPELARLGVRRLDLLMLSHGDADHAGAASDIVDGIRTARIVSGTPRQIVGVGAVESCRDGYAWTWDGVSFRQFHPGGNLAGAGDNDRSCVLLIGAAGGSGSLLLTGDVELLAQQRLLNAAGLDRVDVVLAPHHGSRGALYPPLIARLGPREVIFSAAYRSRFGHPHAAVTAAYAAAGARPWNTAQAGALHIAAGPQGLEVTAQRARRGRWWRVGAPQAP